MKSEQQFMKMIASRYLTYILAVLFLLLGVILYFVVPKVNDAYSLSYSNWGTIDELSFNAFQWPSFVWLVTFSSIAAFLASMSSQTKQGKVNVASIISLILVLVLLANWLTGYMFCHSWGCSGLIDV